MRLLTAPSSSSSADEGATIIVEGACASGSGTSSSGSGTSLRRPLRRPVLRHTSTASPHRRLCVFCAVVLVALLILAANLGLLLAALEAFMALLKFRCAGKSEMNGGRMGTMSTTTSSSRSSPTSTERRRTTIAVRPSSPVYAIFSSFSPSSTSSSSSSYTSSSSSSSSTSTLPPTRPRLHLFPANFTSTPYSKLPLSTFSNKTSPSPTSPRIRVTASTTKTAGTTTVPAKVSPLQGIAGQKGTRRHSLTIVTCLLDIGRDRWVQYGRTLRQYHQFLRLLLQLRIPMILFVDKHSAQFVHRERVRIGRGHWTQVRQLSLQDLPLSAFHAQIARIMEDERTRWRPEWDPAMRTHPEAAHPEYIAVVNSKPYFLAEAAADNPFKTEFFAWLDAGYGHGNRDVFPENWQWRPEFQHEKISLIKLTPRTDPIGDYGMAKLYRQDVAVLSAGFLAGDRQAINRLYRAHQRMFMELLDRQMVDDEQTLLVLLANQHPDWFAISHGDWFDAFKLF